MNVKNQGKAIVASLGVTEGVIREIKSQVGNSGVEMCIGELEWKLNTFCLLMSLTGRVKSINKDCK